MCAKKSMPYISKSFKSLFSQTYKNFEFIVCFDNTDDDGTETFLNKNKKKINILFNLNNKGIYHCLNKAIQKASGEIIGILHSDDVYHNNKILEKVSIAFDKNKNADILYADIEYISNRNSRVIRKWKAGNMNKNKIYFGWMPPHTSMFIKKHVAKTNCYNEKYKISSDYDLILRLIKKNYKFNYLNLTSTSMRIGGLSNGNFKNIILKSFEDLQILKANKFKFSMIILILKNLRKIIQFF